MPDDKKGCLQDVHWSHGSFGYFPTYSLGSFYAAQFYNQAKLEVQDLEIQIEKGNTQPLLQWLRTAVHQKGRFYTSRDLSRAITNNDLQVSSFISYLLDKFASIYTL